MKKLDIAQVKKSGKRFLKWVIGHKDYSVCIVVAIILLVFSGLYTIQNARADNALISGKKLDDAGHYLLAKNELKSVSDLMVRESTKKQIAAELKRNERLFEVEAKLNEIKELLREHKPAEAQKLLQSIQSNLPTSSSQSKQISALNQTVNKIPASKSQGSASSSGSGGKSSTGGSGGSSSGGGGSGGNGGSGGGGSSNSPLTNLSISSFSASSSPETSSTCDITDSVTFSSNGSGSVTATWSLFSTKTVSETNNPDSFTFSSAGSQSDSFNFSGSQGLESGDEYRVSVTIASVSDPAITTTANPIYISNCASPPSLAAEQSTPIMTSITPGTISVSQQQDGIFPNECSVQVTTPYSVNSAGTVEAIVSVTSAANIGYTYYDNDGVTAFTGPGSNSDTSYFRLPHLPGGGVYTIKVKLVEVSEPNTVYANTSSTTSVCN